MSMTIEFKESQFTVKGSKIPTFLSTVCFLKPLPAAPADTLFPAAFHQKVVRLIQENKDLPPVQTIVLTEFDPTMEELFTSTEYTLTKVRLDSSFDLWELSYADGTSLVAVQGVDLWAELNVSEQDTLSAQINNFAPIEGECLSLE